MLRQLRICAFGLLSALSSTAQAQTPPKVLLVSDNNFRDSRNIPGAPVEDAEVPFVNFLTGLGYQVIRSTGAFGGMDGEPAAQFRENREGFLGAANSGADLIIISRVTDSGGYDAADQINGWNSISIPMLIMNAQVARNNRWRMANFGNHDEASSSTLDFVFTDAGNFVYDGLTPNLLDPPSSPGDVRSYSRVDLPPDANGLLGSGVVLATFNGDAAVVLFEPGIEYYPGSGQTPGGQRVIFGGIRYHESAGADPVEFEDLSENGQAILARTLNLLAPIPEPGTISLLAFGGLLIGLRPQRA